MSLAGLKRMAIVGGVILLLFVHMLMVVENAMILALLDRHDWLALVEMVALAPTIAIYIVLLYEVLRDKEERRPKLTRVES
ncbi:hypothetical protein [Pyrodictium abyssi]|uniref:Uncharacterized protein n=1 Tax=Pyrodictium abyssi TaxID=54256 RepID=A0ABN6ZRY2_9CREN|nr:hypothetical protein PABY_08170 [Pyrodictium abyssi]